MNVLNRQQMGLVGCHVLPVCVCLTLQNIQPPEQARLTSLIPLQARQALHIVPRARHQTCHRQRAVSVHAAIAAPPQAETMIAGDVSQLIGVLLDHLHWRSSCGRHVEDALFIASLLQAITCASLPGCHATRKLRQGREAGWVLMLLCNTVRLLLQKVASVPR